MRIKFYKTSFDHLKQLCVTTWCVARTKILRSETYQHVLSETYWRLVFREACRCPMGLRKGSDDKNTIFLNTLSQFCGFFFISCPILRNNTVWKVRDAKNILRKNYKECLLFYNFLIEFKHKGSILRHIQKKLLFDLISFEMKDRFIDIYFAIIID